MLILIGQGKTVPEVCKEIEVSEQTYYRWRQKYGGMSPEMVNGIRQVHRLATEMNPGQTVGRSRRFVQGWVYRYRDHGLEAIVPKRQTGRPPNLPPTKEEPFKERFLAAPTEADGVCTLRAKEAQRILQEEFGVEYTLAGVYDLLHRLGLSYLAPRPRHRKNDPEQMQQWVENAPLLSGKSPKRTRSRKSRSGSKMKRGSASKGP